MTLKKTMELNLALNTALNSQTDLKTQNVSSMKDFVIEKQIGK
jgi:hypothetical protein